MNAYNHTCVKLSWVKLLDFDRRKDNYMHLSLPRPVMSLSKEGGATDSPQSRFD